MITHLENTEPFILWGARIARAEGTELAVLCWTEGKEPQPVEAVSMEDDHEGDDMMQAVKKGLETAASEGLTTSQITVHRVIHPKPLKAISSYVMESGTDLMVTGTYKDLRVSEKLYNDFFKNTPCTIMVVDTADHDPRNCKNILVPLGGAYDGFALRLGAKLAADSDGAMFPLMIEANIGEDAMEVGYREVKQILSMANVKMTKHIHPKVTLSDDVTDGIIAKANQSDLVLIGARSLQALERLRQQHDFTGRKSLPRDTALALIRGPSVRGATGIRGKLGRLVNWIPQLQFEDRVSLLQQLKSGSEWTIDFRIMLSLSAAIASLGLLNNSAAVIIGAMLVAPLMTPMIGGALALIQGNIQLAKDSSRAIIYGFLAALIISFIFGFLAPEHRLTKELLARGAPNILDFIIAFLSGGAAAYAMARPGLVGVISGVAMASAIVPPICTVGISLATLEFRNGQGAAILFAANVVAVILGASWIFNRMGIRGIASTGTQASSKLWVRRTMLTLILLSVIIIFPLVYFFVNQIADQKYIGHRVRGVSQEVYDAIEKQVEEEPDVTLVGMVQPSTKRDYELLILLSSTRQVDPSFADKLYEEINKLTKQRHTISIIMLENEWARILGKPEEADANSP